MKILCFKNQRLRLVRYLSLSLFHVIVTDNIQMKWQANLWTLSHILSSVLIWLAYLTDRISHLNASFCQTCESLYGLILASCSEDGLHATMPNATHLIPLSGKVVMQVDDYAVTQKLCIFHYKFFSEFEIDSFYKREIIKFFIILLDDWHV